MHPTRQQIAESVIKAITDKGFYDDPQITEDTRIVEDLGMDSLDLMEVCSVLEKIYSVEDIELLPDGSDLETIGDIITAVEEAVKAKAI
jgi:acyl carrier protein